MIRRAGIISVILIACLASCDLWGPRDNPVDPDAEGYQGYVTVTRSTDIGPVSPADGDGMTDTTLVINPVAEAISYELRIASTASDLDSNPVFVKDDYSQNLLSISAATLSNSTTYFWKARSKGKDGVWGEWSRAFHFTTAWSLLTPPPVFTPPGGYFYTAQTLSLSCSNPMARIFYTLDGSVPTKDSTEYLGDPIVLDDDGTITWIKAIAETTGYAPSQVGENSYGLDYSVWVNRFPTPDWTYYTAVTCSSDGSRIVVASENSSIWTSSDYGVTWTKSNAPDKYWNSIASNSDGSIMAAVSDGIWTSSDYGVSWVEQFSIVGKTWRAVASNADGSRLAAGVHGGYIWTSEDYGATWEAHTATGIRNWRSIASSSDGSKLAAAESDGHIWTTTDYGNTWTERTSAGYRSWNSICSDSGGDRLAAVEWSGGLLISQDSGLSWITPPSGSTGGGGVVACSSDGRKLVSAGSSFINSSKDFGVSWVPRRASTWKNYNSIASNSDGTRIVAVSGPYGIWTGVLPP